MALREVCGIVHSDCRCCVSVNYKPERSAMTAQLLNRRIGSATADARLAQILTFLAACVIPVLAFRKFADMELTEFQLMMAALATMSLSVLCALLGLVCGR